MLIFAGVPTWTYNKGLPGCRSEHVQWYQDVPNQALIISPYSRYSNEIKCAEHVEPMVNRALLMASTGCPGPSYLTASREILAAPTTIPLDLRLRPSTSTLGGFPQQDIELIGSALMKAQHPLVVTGYLGRNREAVPKLVALADAIRNLQVFDAEFRAMSFPADHPAWITLTTGALQAIQNADVILVFDADVPWIPAKVQPSPSAQIFHIDLDPRKEKMNFFDIQATATFLASSTVALEQLLTYISSSNQSREPVNGAQDDHEFTSRVQSHRSRLETLSLRAQPPPSDELSKHYLFASLRALLPEDTIFVSDAVTNQVPMSEQLQLTRPGTNFTKGASGLGWAGGAAIGIKLATQLYNTDELPDLRKRLPPSKEKAPPKFICMIIGDGAFTFGSPTAIYNAAHRLKTPFLSVIINNGGWKAVHTFVKELHPQGVAARMTEADLGMDLSHDGPEYGQIAKAASSGQLWTSKVTKASELGEVIKSARKVVEGEQMGALIDAVIV